jgi:hypothetical protein
MTYSPLAQWHLVPLVQIDGLDRHLQFVLPLHRFFELLVDDFHPIFFFGERVFEAIVCRVLILFHFLKSIFERNLVFVLRFLRENHFPAGFIHGEDRFAAGALHANGR